MGVKDKTEELKTLKDFELIGRFGIFGAILFLINQTVWYQSLPICKFQRECWTFNSIFIYIMIIFLIIWVVYPLLIKKEGVKRK